MVEPTEDVPYSAPQDFSIPEAKQEQQDPDTPNKSVLHAVVKYLDEAIEEHNSMDVLDLTEAAKMNPTQQVAVHKLVTQHLRSIRDEVNNKLKELK